MKKLFLVLCFALLLQGVHAQSPLSSGEIYLGLKKLQVLGSVLYIAAHPDDENTRLITYFSKDRLYRTGYLSLTRGDGGQNLIGDEQGIELGLIRTQELLAARRIDGGEQFFSRAFDFGFSKTPEETFTKWDREKILSDVVWVIRKFQPDVIITRFPTTGEGGHGHHTASAILANEAFKAAADPSKFPSQLQWVSVWQPKRIVWNGFNFNNAAPPEGSLKLDVGGYNPVLGKSYGEIAAESRTQHKSQGFGSSGSRGEVYEFFRPTGGTEAKGDLMEDVNTTWARIGAGNIETAIGQLIRDFDFMNPQRSVPALAALHKNIAALPASAWRTKKLEEAERLIEACSGLYADATVSVPIIAQGDSLRVNFVFNNRLGADLRLRGISMQGVDTSLGQTLAKNNNLALTRTIVLSFDQPITQPYWLANEMKEGYFAVRDQQLIGIPDVQPAFTARFEFSIAGENFVINRPVRYRFNDPVKGEIYQPLVVIPPYTVRPAHQLTVLFPQLLPDHKKSEEFEVIAHSRGVPVKVFGEGKLLLERSSSAMGAHYRYSAPLDNKLYTAAANEVLSRQPYTADKEGKLVLKTVKDIAYDHIPHQAYFVNAVHRTLAMDIRTAGKRIGYITGAGDRVPEALEEMGYEVVLLGDKELGRNNLQQFDAIITGVRAYNTNEWMNDHYDALMSYVKRGGNLIVQYNTSNNIGPVRARISPFPFEISRNRVTDENAAVEILQKDHPVFNYPNKISEKDFSGWVQERSTYHAASTDTAFRKLIRMADPGERADDGSLIVAKYGDGYFTYTGLGFFRQLPAGVPGAYRLMANLIALNRKKEF